jgi:hypothetical protein
MLDDACPERTVKEGQTRRHILTYCNANPSIKSDRSPVQSFQMLRDARDFVILCFLALRRDDVSSLSHIAKFCPIGGLKFYLFGSSILHILHILLIRIPLGPLRCCIFYLKHREILNILIFCYVTQCVWAKCSRRFEGTTCLRNVGNHSPTDTASHPGRSETPAIPTWVPKILHFYVIQNLGFLFLRQMNRLFMVLFFSEIF